MALIVLVLLVGTAILLRVTIATWIVAQALEDTPFQNANFRLVSLGHDQVVVDDLVLDYPFTTSIARAAITFDAFDALNGHLDSISIDGLTAAVTLETLEAFFGQSEDGGMPVQIGRLSLHDGDVLLSLGDQDVHVRLAGEFANIDPLIGSFQVSATGRQFMLQGPVDIASRVNGVLSLAWQIDDGRLETPDAVLGGLKGEFLLERTLDHKADIAVNLTLSSDSIRLDQHNLEQFHVELAGLVGMPATLANTTAQAVVELGTSSTPVHGRIAASLAQVSDGPQLTLDLDIDLNDDLTLDDGTGVSIASPSTLSSHIVTALPDAAVTEDIDPLGLALTHILDLSAQFRTGGIAIGERFATTSAEGEVVIRLNGDDATATISAPLTVRRLDVRSGLARHPGPT